MAELTPDERQRVYEEEKARLEAEHKASTGKPLPLDECLEGFGGEPRRR